MIVKGQKINDRYEIVKLIGEGGMANVYLGYDTILERDVAIKVLRGDLADDEKFVRRFRREAQSASLLNHPNIVQIYDVGEDDGNFYIVMEYIKGQTLKQLIKKRGRLSVSETVDIMLQLSDGLAHAHDSYIIHRDIKPQNIMILDDGMVKITDFGIAMAINASDLTQTNSVMGSVHYLPPEQASGKGSTIKSDIYSLGIVMYEMLAGTMPFRGETAVEIAMKHLKEPMPSIRKVNDTVPQSVENIILKATAKNPKNRYNNVRELYEDLKTCQDKSRENEKRIVFQYPENEYDDENTKVVNNLKEDLKDKKNDDKNLDVKEIDNDEYNDKKLSKFTKVLITLVSVLVIALFSVFIIIPAITSETEVSVPDVVGLKENQARQRLEDKGLKVNTEVKDDYTDQVKKGLISRTNPKVGSEVKKGSRVTLYKSLGSEKIILDDYSGKQYNKVKKELEEKGLDVEIENKDVDDRKKYENNKNVIIDQNPKKGTSLLDGDTVTLYIPNLPEVYPNFVSENYTANQVRSWCKDHDIVLTVVDEDSIQQTGTIIYQSRQAGSDVVSGADLTIKVAKHKEPQKPTGTDSENIDNTPTTNNTNTNTTGEGTN